MKQLLIVSHTPSGNTRLLSDALVRGASDDSVTGVQVICSRPLNTGPNPVLSADAIILSTTENFGYMSGAMKDFFDRIYYPCLGKTNALPWALVVRAGNDGSGARTSVERIVSGLNWKAVQPPLVCAGDWQAKFVSQCEELGLTLAAGLEAGIF